MLHNLLIVGGTGFIGLHVAKEALNRGFLVTIIALHEKKESEKIDGIEYLCLDIQNKETLKNKIGGRVYHYVINLGGYIDHSGYFDNGSQVIDAHFKGTRNLVDCINRKHLRTFVQIGSSDEYGCNSAPQNEDQRELPISAYSFAKTAITKFLEMLYVSENYPAVVIRLFLVYGPGQNNDRFIPQLIKGCMNDTMFATSNGEQLRDFCFIDDVVNGIFSCFDNKKAYGQVINLASGVAVSIKNVIDLVKDLIGMGYPDFGSIPYRKGENMSLYANTSKAKNFLNWTAKTELSKGISVTVDYYKRNL